MVADIRVNIIVCMALIVLVAMALSTTVIGIWAIYKAKLDIVSGSHGSALKVYIWMLLLCGFCFIAYNSFSFCAYLWSSL